jgi:methylmalonyl-CoA/ethylmalonyl-CoA epimerase
VADGVNCVHHVVWCVRPESIERVRTLCEEALGLEMQDLDLPELGLHVLIAWEAGIEIMSPTYAEGTLADTAREFLDRRGEGVYSVVYNVADIDDASARLTGLGATLLFAEDIAAEEFDDRQVSTESAPVGVRQALFDDVCGMRICLQQLSSG